MIYLYIYIYENKYLLVCRQPELVLKKSRTNETWITDSHSKKADVGCFFEGDAPRKRKTGVGLPRVGFIFRKLRWNVRKQL